MDNIKLFYVGDFVKENGPSNVDIKLKENLHNKDASFCQSNKRPSLKKIVNYFECPIVHISGVSFWGMVFCIIGRLLAKKITYMAHGFLYREACFRRVPLHRRLFEYILLKLSHRIIVVSNLMKDDCLFPSKVSIVPNGVDLSEKASVTKNSSLITCIGGGRVEKNHLAVCRVIQQLNQEGHQFKLNLFGEESSESPEIRRFDFVTDYGFVSRKVIEKSLLESQLFIQYSVQEAFSLAVAEAINCHCKIITSQHVGINQYVEEGQHYHIVHDDNELKQSILTLMSDDRPTCIKHKLLSWSDVALEYQKVWRIKN